MLTAGRWGAGCMLQTAWQQVQYSNTERRGIIGGDWGHDELETRGRVAVAFVLVAVVVVFATAGCV